MNEEQVQELSEVLFGLAGNFGDTLDESTVRMWIRAFEADGISVSQVKEASLKILGTRKISKMPTYAEFLDYIVGSSEDRAQQQADVVLYYLRKHGRMGKPAFDDAITAYLMETRWPYQRWAASLMEGELKWWRKEFIQAYQSYARYPERFPAKHQHQIDVQKHLQGLIDRIGNEEDD